MEWIIDNWAIIVAFICMVFSITQYVIMFVLEPKDKKLANVKEWLLYAVVEAEKALGGGTGALKLRYVYNLAVAQFEWLPKVVDFNTFSKWVDDALIWMRVQLESNKQVQNYIEGDAE